MDIGAYQGASALNAYEKWQDVISQNIAYGTVPGYKKMDVSFGGILSGTGTMPSVSTQTNFTPGQMQRTDNKLDFAIQGDGFFQIKAGNGQLAYTRNGQFHLDPNRRLVTGQGATVMGEGGPITLQQGGGAPSVNPDGTITQAGEPVGKLSVYSFKDTQKLQRTADGAFAPADPGMQPQKVAQPQLLNGYVESSNVSPLGEMVNLINVSRAFEAGQKVISSSDEEGGKAIETLGNPPTSS